MTDANEEVEAHAEEAAIEPEAPEEADAEEPDAEVLIATQQAIAHALAAMANPESPRLIALAERRDALAIELAAVQTAKAEVAAYLMERRREALLATARAYRFKPALEGLSDEQVLKLVPDVDPSTPEGLYAFERWRQAAPGLFASFGIRGESLVAAARLERPAAGSTLFDHDRLSASIFRR